MEAVGSVSWAPTAIREAALNENFAASYVVINVLMGETSCRTLILFHLNYKTKLYKTLITRCGDCTECVRGTVRYGFLLT
jgi:hypothetical protein